MHQAGARACTAKPTVICAGEQDAYLQQNGTYQLALTPGTWWVSGLVYVYGSGPTSTEVVTAPRKVVVVAGAQVTESFVVAVS